MSARVGDELPEGEQPRVVDLEGMAAPVPERNERW